MYIFSMDNPFFQFIGKLVDLVWLNILTLVCCLPVFTAGAALSAMYSVLIKMALKEDGVITKPFFRAFKENLKAQLDNIEIERPDGSIEKLKKKL